MAVAQRQRRRTRSRSALRAGGAIKNTTPSSPDNGRPEGCTEQAGRCGAPARGRGRSSGWRGLRAYPHHAVRARHRVRLRRSQARRAVIKPEALCGPWHYSMPRPYRRPKLQS